MAANVAQHSSSLAGASLPGAAACHLSSLKDTDKQMQREGNNDAEGASAVGGGVGFAVPPRNYRGLSAAIMARSVCGALARWLGSGGISPRGRQPPPLSFYLPGGWLGGG